MRSFEKPAKWLGFTPDLDPTLPGTILSCLDVVGSDAGIKAPYSWATGPSLAPPYSGKILAACMSNSGALFVATETHVYRVTFNSGTSTWSKTDVTPANWFVDEPKFSRLGNYTIMMQRARAWHWLEGTATAWTQITGLSGALDVVFPHDNFLVIGDGTTWRTSDVNDPTDFTTGAPSLAEFGQFADTDGGFTGGASLGPYAVLYKRNSIRLGRPASNGRFWSWTRVPTRDGCYYPGSLVSISDSHLYFGRDDIYRFDGSRPVSIGMPVRQWLLNRLHQISFVQARYDPESKTVYWFLSSGVFSPLDARYDVALTYHIKSDKFGLKSAEHDCSLQDLDAFPLSADGAIIVEGKYLGLPFIGAFRVDGTYQRLAGVPGASTLTTGYYGSDDEDTQVNRVLMRFMDRPASGSCTHTAHDEIAGPAVSTGIADGRGRWDFNMSARWHQDKIDLNGSWESTHIDTTRPKAEGRR